MKNVADVLVEQFSRMVRREGSQLSLIGVEGPVIRVGYKLGADPDCADGACVLPHLELQQLMAETLARRAPDMHVVVEVVK